MGTSFAFDRAMTRPKFHGFDPGFMREELRKIRNAKNAFQEAEENLVLHLRHADHNKLYAWLGFRTLTSYCVRGLKIGETQAQRLVTRVRRLEETNSAPVKEVAQDDVRTEKYYLFADEESE